MRVCLIGATHPSHNPRLIREADSLAAAGHDVRVVAPSFMVDLRAKDERLLQNRNWRLEAIDFCPGGLAGTYRAYTTRGARRMFEEIFKLTSQPRYRDHAYTPALRALTAAAMAKPADWFIAHAHRALPVAAAAASRWQARLGFDCEDLLGDVNSDSAGIARLVEETYLKRCDYVSVPSESVGEELTRVYGELSLVVLYNFFPTALVNGMLPPRLRSRSETLKLYWFSQTIGPGRGLEDALTAVSMLGGGVEVHLRGSWANGYEEKIRKLAAALKVSLQAHPTLDHDQLIQSMQEFDVGLALEPSENRNASLTQSNKIGSYFLAGLGIAATDTPGQAEVLGQESRAGFLYPSGRPELLAAGLKRWVDDRDALSEAQQAAWDIARKRFCWDLEQDKFFRVLGISDSRRLASTRSA